MNDVCLCEKSSNKGIQPAFLAGYWLTYQKRFKHVIITVQRRVKSLVAVSSIEYLIETWRNILELDWQFIEEC